MELIKRWARTLRPHLRAVGWSIASGLVGSGIGLVMVMLWMRVR